jgi:hypothetical protein
MRNDVNETNIELSFFLVSRQYKWYSTGRNGEKYKRAAIFVVLRHLLVYLLRVLSERTNLTENSKMV